MGRHFVERIVVGDDVAVLGQLLLHQHHLLLALHDEVAARVVAALAQLGRGLRALAQVAPARVQHDGQVPDDEEGYDTST